MEVLPGISCSIRGKRAAKLTGNYLYQGSWNVADRCHALSLEHIAQQRLPYRAFQILTNYILLKPNTLSWVLLTRSLFSHWKYKLWLKSHFVKTVANSLTSPKRMSSLGPRGEILTCRAHPWAVEHTSSTFGYCLCLLEMKELKYTLLTFYPQASEGYRPLIYVFI